jgi:hypothetical protein
MSKLALVALVALTACGARAVVDEGALPNAKWFVCKYESTPDGGERLQSGQNPISVAEDAFPAGVVPAVGVEFNDAQGRSLIIAADVGQPEPSADACPPPNPPPPTTEATTTETAAPTTTSSTTTPGSTTTSAGPTTTTTIPATTTTTTTIPGDTTPTATSTPAPVVPPPLPPTR